MKVYYRPAAVEDLQRTVFYIRNNLNNPTAASRLASQILHSVSLLGENPFMGASLAEKVEIAPISIRFLIVYKQIVFYEVHDSAIEIIRILDSRTDYLVQLLS